ncbi:MULTISPECIES: FliM/FliN family flagellar motor switch protein [unclassified Pseudomonas]|uniref:FliM/FliN family flagellar motor switch protein n=1 Tax=unclassified Pseudomonas TaxID=196821 RepID=UPI0030DC81AC
MNAQALRLRSLSQAEASVRERVGAGLSLHLSQPSPATLTLRLAPRPFHTPPATAFESACGLLWLDAAGPLLSELSSCPAILADPMTATTDCPWYWPLYNQYLAPELQVALSPLHAVATAPAPGLDCLLELHRTAAGAHISRLRIAADTLLRWLDHGPWRASRASTGDRDWPVSLPLLLGHCALSRGELLTLRAGDVLLIPQPLFTAQGLGSLQVGACRLHLRQQAATALHFTLTELEDLPMNASLDHFALGDHEPLNEVDASTLAVDDTASERFDDLPVALTLRAGSLNLSLGQLRSLSVGSVLRFSGCTPGQAMLCQGELVLAQGELVDIEGRLGLQITRLELRP